MKGRVRNALVGLVTAMMIFGWMLPAGAAPITATVCLNSSTGAGIPGAEALFNSGVWQSIGFTDGTGCVSTDLAAARGNRTFRISYRGQTQNKTQNTITNPVVVFQTAGVVVRLLDSTGSNGIPSAAIHYNAGGWQSLGSTDASGTVTAELLGVNTNFRVTHGGQTQQKTQNTGTDPNVTFQTGKVLQGTGPRVVAWWAAGWHPFSNGVELLPGNVTFDLSTGPNQVHTVVAGSTIYVPIAPTAPVVIASDESGNEGEPVTIASVSFTDQETTQTHTATIDWGDGSALESGTVSQSNGLAGTVTGSHVYADDGGYTVEICVSDDGDPDAEGCDTLQVTVANLAPQVIIVGVPGAGAEGTAVSLSALATDADVVTLSWSASLDGSLVASGFEPDFTFLPVDDGTYEVSLTADDGEGGITTTSGQVTVTNLSPVVVITGIPDSAIEDQPVILGSIASDAGVTDVLSYGWTVSVDGATVAAGSGAGISFTPDGAGSYLVTLTVLDGDGGSARSEVVIEVGASAQPDPDPEPDQESPTPPAKEPPPPQEPTPDPKPSTDSADDNHESETPHLASSSVDVSGTTDPDILGMLHPTAQPATQPEPTDVGSAGDESRVLIRPDMVMNLALVSVPEPAEGFPALLTTALYLSGLLLFILITRRVGDSEV